MRVVNANKMPMGMSDTAIILWLDTDLNSLWHSFECIYVVDPDIHCSYGSYI